MDNYVNSFIDNNKFEITENCTKFCFKNYEENDQSKNCLEKCFQKYQNSFLFFTQKLFFNQKNFKEE